MAAVAALPPHLSRFGLLGCCKGSSWSVIALESAATEVVIRGYVAQVCAKLVYLNNSAETLQVKAVFPVDEGAAVYHCEAHLGDRTIVTHCMEKKQAEKVYSEAVRMGHTAVMAREHEFSSDILQLNLGNLPAESRAELMLKMVMELKVQTDGGISFVLPTVLNPRYCPPDHPPQERINSGGLFGFCPPRMVEPLVHVPKPYTIEVKATVSGSHTIARIVSRTDPINTTLADDALSAQVSQDGGFESNHDWSFVVYYNNPYAPHLLRETGDRSATGIMKDDLLMLNFFPEVPENTYSNKNEIIFVIDRSGSMTGSKMQNAKVTLLLFLKSLPAGCLFNVVSFGNSFVPLFHEGSCKYSEKTLKMACNLQATMNADMGGTEILQPLQSIYSKPPTPGYSRQILLITDGEVMNVDQVLQLVGRQAHETRLFCVGVGHGASTALVRGVARAGRGRSEMVVEENLLQEKVMGLVGSMVQESVQDVSIECEVEPANRVRLVPKVPPVIFGGQHLILYARVPATTQVKSVAVRGQLGTKPLLTTVEGRQITTVHDEAKSLHRLAARAQLLQWQLDEEEDVAEDMVALSTASGVVCRRTALVGVDKESGTPIADVPSSDEASSSSDDEALSGCYGASTSGRGQMRKCRGQMRKSNAWGQHMSTSFGSRSGALPLQSPVPLSFGSAQPSSAVPPPGGSGLFDSQSGALPVQSAFTFGNAHPASAVPSGLFGCQSEAELKPFSGAITPLCRSAAAAQSNFFAAQPLPRSSAHLGAQKGAADLKIAERHESADLMQHYLDEQSYDEMSQSYTVKIEHSDAGKEAPPSSAPLMEKQPLGLLGVVSLQQFDGSWTLEDAAKLTDLSLDTLSANNPAKGKAAWGTALVLVLLEMKFSEKKEQWTLLAHKAQTFITGCGEQVEDLLAKARNILQANLKK